MESLSIHKYNANLYWCFILIISIGIIKQTFAAAVASQNTVSLYTQNDKVAVLTGHNFSSIVYQSKTAWLVEFYASWCGHCQSYANTYREVAIDAWGWRTVVRIGAINCYADENNAVCEQHNIMGYPTLRFIEPNASKNSSVIVTVSATDAKGVERELIKKLMDVKIVDNAWPNFTPISRPSFDDVYSRVLPSVKLILVIIEKKDDFTGSQIMLDFSKYFEKLVIFRTTTDKKLWYKFQVNMSDIPALFAIHRNQTVEKINVKQENTSENIGHRTLFNYAIRSYIRRGEYIENFDDRDLEEINLSKKALKNAETKTITNKINEDHDKVVNEIKVNQKISMVDLETSLSYMLRHEIPRMPEIRGETFDALVTWLTVLTKYFPGREPVMNYLKQLLSKVNEQSNGLTGKQFRALADMNTTSSYLPSSIVRFEHCAGSSAKYRGYPCTLWVLFHTLTVSQVQSATEEIKTIEVPSAIKKFIKHYFGCRHCSENFVKGTKNMDQQLDPKNKYAAVIYFWQIHNYVNNRLHGDVTEDPEHPKIQFPPDSLCSTCRRTTENKTKEFDTSKTLKFLLQYYSKENFDLSSVEILSTSNDQKEDIKVRNRSEASIENYSMIEINNESKWNNGIIQSIFSIIQRFPLYFVILIIVIIFLRRRYCKGKRKRYTL